MAIKKSMQYNQAKGDFVGFVDLGQNVSISSNSQELATEALVIMAVGITGHWKQAIGYFLTNGLSAEVQKELVLHSIESLSDAGIRVKALTLDGLSANLSMLRKLGCSTSVDSLQSSFRAPNGETVFCFIDACHCLKMVRNTFARVGNIEVPDGQYAQWNHITTLNDFQKQEGLVAANRLTDRHVHYQLQVMKVR